MIEYKSRTREEQLQELSDFIEKTQEEIVDIASALNWSIETVVTDNIQGIFGETPFVLSVESRRIQRIRPPTVRTQFGMWTNVLHKI